MLTCRDSSHDTNYGATLESANIEQTEILCREFTAALEETLANTERPEGEKWLLGGGPTIIDAHVVPMIRRLLDRERSDLVPAAVEAYAKGVIESEEWERTAHGRGTVYDRSYGPARDLNPM